MSQPARRGRQESAGRRSGWLASS